MLLLCIVLQVVLVMGLLYWLLDTVAFIALLAILLLVIMQYVLMRIFSSIHSRTMVCTGHLYATSSYFV